VWIETIWAGRAMEPTVASPGSNAGCGLKPELHLAVLSGHGASPGSNAGCGLKPKMSDSSDRSLSITRQQRRVWIETQLLSVDTLKGLASPGSNAGCGLKHSWHWATGTHTSHHPAATPGVD